jgi:hypothetical protein
MSTWHCGSFCYTFYNEEIIFTLERQEIHICEDKQKISKITLLKISEVILVTAFGTTSSNFLKDDFQFQKQ